MDFQGNQKIRNPKFVFKSGELLLFQEWQQTVNSVKKWLIANKKDDKDIKNLDEIAASRVKYTLPGTVYIFGQ